MENLTDRVSVLEMQNFCRTESRQRGVEISAKVLRAERASQSRETVQNHLKSFVENMSAASFGCLSAAAAWKEVGDSFCGEADQQNTEMLGGEADQDRKKQTHCVKMKMWRLWSDLGTVMLQQDEEEAALNDKEMAWHHEYQEIVLSLVEKLQDSHRHNEDLIMENIRLKERIRLLTEEVAINKEIIEEKTKEAMDEEKIRQHYERRCEKWRAENKRLAEEMEEMMRSGNNKKRLKEEVLPDWESWNTEQEVVDADAANKKMKMERSY